MVQVCLKSSTTVTLKLFVQSNVTEIADKVILKLLEDVQLLQQTPFKVHMLVNTGNVLVVLK